MIGEGPYKQVAHASTHSPYSPQVSSSPSAQQSLSFHKVVPQPPQQHLEEAITLTQQEVVTQQQEGKLGLPARRDNRTM